MSGIKQRSERTFSPKQFNLRTVDHCDCNFGIQLAKKDFAVLLDRTSAMQLRRCLFMMSQSALRSLVQGGGLNQYGLNVDKCQWFFSLGTRLTSVTSARSQTM